MEIILKEDIIGLGYKNEIVNVLLRALRRCWQRT